MIFWYPGEAGSTEIAQPTLDMLFDYINKRVPEARITGRYFNTYAAGLEFIKARHPSLGILSLAAFDASLGKLGRNSVLLKTRPLPHGKTVEKYVIVGKGPPAKEWNVPLYTKQPLTEAFVKKYIVPEAAEPKISAVPAIMAL